MPTRRELADARRLARHSELVASASTATGRLWRTCNWLISAAKRRGRLTETLAAVQYLIHLIEQDQPLPRLPGAHQAPTDPDDAPATPWYAQRRHQRLKG